MAINVKISTPRTQIERDSSALNVLHFNGNKGRKIFTLENLSSSTSTANIELSLEQGTGDAFVLYPGVGTTGSFNIDPGYKISLMIDYDSSRGSSVYASLTASLNIYGEFGSSYVIGPTTSLNFTVDNPGIKSSRNIGPLLSQDSNGDYIVQQASSKKIDDNSSFGVLRTNPKLTGNVAITVDSKFQIWLNSIDAEKELADDKYKKYTISPDSSYAIDIKRFFNDGKTPSEIVYSLYEFDKQFSIIPYSSTRRNFSEQYDRFYHYGASQLNSKLYDEDFTFFAPLYIKEEIPEYFVIFRTEGPLNNFTYEDSFINWKDYIVSDIISKSQIVKVYDMGENSSIGKYLRNIVKHPSRKKSDITVSYNRDGYTTFNGISYNAGTYVQAGELFYDFMNEENPLSIVEEFVTLGFQRNKVLSTHLFNLEFLFDDDTAKDYSINRYFGLYVNTVDLANFELSAEALAEFSYSMGQTPIPRKGVDGTTISQKSFVQYNEKGMKLYVDAESIQSYPRLSNYSFSSLVSSIELDGFTLNVDLPGNFYDKLQIGETVRFFNDTLEASAELSSFTYNGQATKLVFNPISYTGDIGISNFPSLSWKADFYTEEKYKTFEQKIFDNVHIENAGRFFYVRDKNNFLNTVESTRIDYVNVDAFAQKKVVELSLKATTLNVSDFSGTLDILTQSESKLLQRGRSTLAVEINKFFSPNDFLEIRWEPGSTSSGYPYRWRVVANSTYIPVGTAWPSFTLSSDLDGEYYLAYFNPGDSSVNFTSFVKSIQTAFDQFTFKNFEVLAKDSFLLFRSTQDGRFSESSRLLYSSTIADTINVMGVPGGTTGSVFFIGGSDRNNTRARVSKEVTEGMLREEYMVTKGSFSKIREYSVLGNIILFSPYLDEPVYDEAGEKLIDFNDSGIYNVVSLTEELSEIQLTSDSKITTYSMFKPSLGVLSILPVKDFDTDYYVSDYTRTYTPELIKYFKRDYPETTVMELSSYVYTFDRAFEFDSYPAYLPFLKLYNNGFEEAMLFNEDAQFVFYSAGATASIEFSQAADVSLFPQIEEKVLFLSSEKAMYFTEDKLSSFKGFLTLSEAVSFEDEQVFSNLENLWDPTRFNLSIESEYDRMAENFLKTLVLKSRVVPYSLKWVSTGRDVRGNPYRFNYQRVFGNMGFSPSETLSAPDPIFFTHEWPYIDNVPDEFPVTDFPESTFSYFFDEISSAYDFSSLKRDWFTYYFSTGYPTEQYMGLSGDYESVKIDPDEKFSSFSYEYFTGKTFTFFRGYRMMIEELDDSRNTVADTVKYDKYRFSVIIKCEEDNPGVSQDPVRFKTVVNEKWKFIVLIITVKINTYRFPNGKLRYVDLYTIDNSNDYGYYVHDTSVTTLPGYYCAVPKDKKLTSGLNLGVNSSDITLSTVYDYYDAYTSDDMYIDNLGEQIFPLSDGNFSNLIAFFEQSGFQTIVTLPSVMEVYDFNTVQLLGNAGYIKFVSSPLAFTVSLPYAVIPWDKYIFYHQTGGNSTLKDVSERLSFSEINKVILGTSEKAIMEYEIYKADGSTSSVPNFRLSTVSPEPLTRVFDYFPVSDPDKPPRFRNIQTIGSVLEQQKDLQTIYRYQGDFSPKFNNVLKFWLREDENFTVAASRDFMFNNTHLGVELKNFSVLTNQFFNKVADREILTISPDSGYSPVYPLINEIAIDKKSLFAWCSSWDKNYYRKYSSTSDYAEINGTEEMKEIKSFFGSKLMKVPASLDLYQFSVEEVETENLIEASASELTFVDNGDSVIITVNVYDRLLREMMGDDVTLRAKEEFLKVMNEVPEAFSQSTLNDKVREYLIKNIINLYEILDVKFYVLRTGNAALNRIETLGEIQQIPSRLVIEHDDKNFSLTEEQLLQKKYLLRKDISLKNLENLKFQVTYLLDSRFYTSLSIGVTIKRI